MRTGGSPSATNSTMSEWFLSFDDQIGSGGWYSRAIGFVKNIADKPKISAEMMQSFRFDPTPILISFNPGEQFGTPLCVSQNSVQDTLRQVYAKSAGGAEAEALKLLYGEIETAFAQRNVAFVDSLLASFDPAMVQRMVAVGLLRGTFRAKAELNAWEGCLARVSKVLTERGQPADKLLRGLIKQHD